MYFEYKSQTNLIKLRGWFCESVRHFNLKITKFCVFSPSRARTFKVLWGIKEEVWLRSFETVFNDY